MKLHRQNWTQRLLIAAMATGIGLTAVSAATLVLAKSESVQKKSREDYDNRLKSVRALSDALKQQAANDGVNMVAVMARVESRIQDAQSLAAVDQFDMGRSFLDEGYQLLQEAIIGLKSGASKAPVQVANESSAASSPSGKENELALKLVSTKALLDAMKRMEANKGNPQAADISRADILVKDAERQLTSGDLLQAERSILEAYSLITSGIVSLQPAGSARTGGGSAATARTSASTTNHAFRADIVLGIASSKALLAAFKQQSAAKGVSNEVGIGRIDAQIREAEKLLADGHLEHANRAIDDSYAMVKASIVSLQTPSPAKLTAAADNASRLPDQKTQEREQVLQKVRAYEQSVNIVQALKEALRRRAAEAGLPRPEVIARIDTLIAEAARLSAGNAEGALVQLAEAQTLVKSELAGLRLK